MMIFIGLRTIVMAILVSVWGIGIIAGVSWSVLSDSRRGEMGSPAAVWLESSRIQRSATRPTLLMFVHPRCPCTRSSVLELIKVIRRAGANVAVRVVQLDPPSGSSAWKESSYETLLSVVPNVTVIRDPGGLETRRFGVKTSGHALLYDSRGELIFNGGLTSTRGQMGAGEGGRRLLANLVGDVERLPEDPIPVFGCPFETPTTDQVAEADSWTAPLP